jgi:hypothetical protein
MNVRPVFVIEDSSEEDDGGDEQKLVLPPAPVAESDFEDHWCCWLFRKKRWLGSL